MADDDPAPADLTPKEIQRALHAAGLYDGAIDGNLHYLSRHALVLFQSAHGIAPANGEMTPGTQTRLREYLVDVAQADVSPPSGH